MKSLVRLLATITLALGLSVAPATTADATLYGCTWGNSSDGTYGWAHCQQWVPDGGARYYRAKTHFEKWLWSCYCYQTAIRYSSWTTRPNVAYAWRPGSGWSAVDTYIQYG